MAHQTPLQTDPGVNQDIVIRRARAATIVFRFLDSNGDAYPIVDDFRFVLKPLAESDDGDALIDITNDDDITITDNEISIPLTAVTSDIDRPGAYYELRNTTTGKNWYQGEVEIVRGKATEDATTEVEDTINLGETVIETTMTLLSQTGAVVLSTFAAALTFDHDKDFETVLGGTTTFTLAASGHNNGVGIIARINEPVAVNFPAGFEAVNGSDSISTTAMNIIIFRYYEDYDGAGNDKVLYVVKNQTAV